MKVRPRSDIVDAEQYLPEDNKAKYIPTCGSAIPTRVLPGYWIVTDINRNQNVFDPELFKQLFERASE